MKFNNLTPDNQLLPQLSEAFNRVMHSGIYINGPEVEAFESEWAAYTGSKYCISVSSGQAALELLLRAYNVGYGDEVIVPSWTAVPTWKAVQRVGAIPRGVDVDYDTMLLKPESVRTNDKTKAIIPVHLYGYRADTDYPYMPLHDGGVRYIIEDACQAHGLKHTSLANAMAWSFYPTKNLGCYGDGGAITTNGYYLIEHLKKIRDSNRLDELQAAFLRVKLKYLDGDNFEREKRVRIYKNRLTDKIKSPFWASQDATGYPLGKFHQYVIRVQDRNKLRQYLASKGIETLIHYPVPPHRLLGYDYDLPVADRLASEVLSLPLWGDVGRVCEVINDFYSTG